MFSFQIVKAKTKAQDIADNVETTIALMKEKDPAKMSEVGAALHTCILDVYSRLPTSLKHLMGDRFKEMGGAAAIADYMVFLKDTGLEHEDVLSCYFECLDVLLNLTDSSFNFASALSETSAFQMLLKEVDSLRTRYKSSKVKLVFTAIGYNVALRLNFEYKQ